MRASSLKLIELARMAGSYSGSVQAHRGRVKPWYPVPTPERGIETAQAAGIEGEQDVG